MRTTSQRKCAWRGAAFLTVLLLLPATTWAGGIQRPNVVGARAVGMGGAYTAVADDALSIYHNPAGLVRMNRADILVGTELVGLIRGYTPPGRDKETGSLAPNPLPVVAGGARILVGRNTFLAMGLGIYNSFGGSVKFDESKVTEGVMSTLVALFEFAPTIAYQVHDKIFIGLSLRLGIAFFNATKSCGEFTQCRHDPIMDPQFETKIRTMAGAGFGYSLGIQIKPWKWLTIGLVYRSNLDVKAKRGESVLSAGLKLDASVELPFPQSMAFGLAFKIGKRVTLAAQFDWVDNSRFQQLFVDVVDWTGPHEMINTPLHMKDSFAAHLGVEVLTTRMLTLRAGLAYDSQSIPDEYRTRELSDAQKMFWDLGATLRFGRWRVDMAFEFMLGGVNHGFKPAIFPSDYMSPGKHHTGGTYSIHVGGGVAW